MENYFAAISKVLNGLKMNSCFFCEKHLIVKKKVVKSYKITTADDIKIGNTIFSKTATPGVIVCLSCRREIIRLKSRFKNDSSPSSLSRSSSVYSEAAVSSKPSLECVEVPYPSCTRSERYCFVCRKSNSRARVPPMVRLNTFRDNHLFIPQNPRCCTDHYLNGTLYRSCLERILKSSHVSVIPIEDFKWLLDTSSKNHDISGHFSVDKTLSEIRERYYFPRMKNYVKQHIRGCIDCLFLRDPGGKRSGQLHPIPVGRRPFATIHIDHYGPLERTMSGNSMILVVICNVTKYVKGALRR